MSYQYARINLAKTNYQDNQLDWKFIRDIDGDTIDKLQDVYRTYCRYKRFSSVMPVFPSEYTHEAVDVIGYYDNNCLEAWSIIQKFDNKNVYAYQFAWTYHKPRLRLGIRSLETECAIYKKLGYDYLYLEQAHLYKKSFDGFEILGPI